MIYRSHSRSGFVLLVLVLLFVSCIPSVVLGSTPASFCKCTCFSNSTIIQLGPSDPHSTSGMADLDRSFLLPREKDKQDRALNCNDCNRKFCLDYNLPVCKGAKEEDVFTTCFQRDSRKDEAVVFIFIFATGGLLVWAALKPWAEKWIEAARERRSYGPVSENADS